MRLDGEINELRKEVKQFRTETRQRLEVIENEVNKHVALNYNRTIIDYVSNMSHDLVANLKCDRPNEEKFCKSQMKSLQDEYLSLLKSGLFTESTDALINAKEKLGSIREMFKEQNRPNCEKCLDNEEQLMESNIQLLRQLKLIETPAISLVQNKATVATLDAEKACDLIVSPISHKARIQIMQSIYEGKNRFNDLSDGTGLAGGQLIYHINKLRDSGYLDQFESKDYVLSNKGLKALVMLAQLSYEIN